MDAGAVDVGAPHQNQLGVDELLGLGAGLGAQGLHQRRGPGGGANRAIQPGGSQAMEEAAIHAGPIQETHIAAIAIRQDALGAMLLSGRFQPRGDRVERRVPADFFKAAFALGANPPHRMQQTLRVILALQILGHLAAQEAPRHRMIGIAFHPRRSSVFHVYQHRARIRTIQGANGPPHF